VHEAGILPDLQVGGQRTQELDVVGGQYFLMVRQRAARIPVEGFEGDLADHRDIVVSQDACQVGDLADQFHHCIGVGAITD
jgi:hypothetical protein